VSNDASSPHQLEQEIEATRQRLAGTIDELMFRASPKNIAKRETAAVKAYFVGPSGAPRTDNILKVAGGIVGAVALFVLVRKVAS
jgi:hypothetical protein